MTREDAKEKIEITKCETYPYLIEDNVDEVIDEIYDELEQRIAKYEFEMECYRQCEEQLKACETALVELESPSTCEECEFSKFYPKEKYCTSCSRFYKDHYEPKKDTE